MAMVSKAWLKDFDVVVEYYQLVTSGEKEWFKQKVKADMDQMGDWVTREAAWIRAGCPVQIVNKWGRVLEVISA